MLQLLLGKFLGKNALQGQAEVFLKVRDQRFKGNVSRGISPQVIFVDLFGEVGYQADNRQLELQFARATADVSQRGFEVEVDSHLW